MELDSDFPAIPFGYFLLYWTVANVTQKFRLSFEEKIVFPEANS
jgi:hypothetical protein